MHLLKVYWSLWRNTRVKENYFEVNKQEKHAIFENIELNYELGPKDKQLFQSN